MDPNARLTPGQRDELISQARQAIALQNSQMLLTVNKIK